VPCTLLRLAVAKTDAAYFLAAGFCPEVRASVDGALTGRCSGEVRVAPTRPGSERIAVLRRAARIELGHALWLTYFEGT